MELMIISGFNAIFIHVLTERTRWLEILGKLKIHKAIKKPLGMCVLCCSFWLSVVEVLILDLHYGNYILLVPFFIAALTNLFYKFI